jgi:PERQ amino acid-rich with GYF domain-containing protein
LPEIFSSILLQDVESPFEVQDYVRSYLGESREAKEFAKQFLEQRSRWRQLQRSVQQGEEDNMCIPAKAVNPGQATDFHEVKVTILIIIFVSDEVF